MKRYLVHEMWSFLFSIQFTPSLDDLEMLLFSCTSCPQASQICCKRPVWPSLYEFFERVFTAFLISWFCSTFYLEFFWPTYSSVQLPIQVSSRWQLELRKSTACFEFLRRVFLLDAPTGLKRLMLKIVVECGVNLQLWEFNEKLNAFF